MATQDDLVWAMERRVKLILEGREREAGLFLELITEVQEQLERDERIATN